MKTFEQFDETELLGADWRKILPKTIEVVKEVENKILRRTFRLGNVIKNANMTQVIYEAEKSLFGHPDEMSMDVYYYDDHKSKMTIDIIYGDLVACEFTVRSPRDVEVVEDTSYGSKFDPSNTIFALSDRTINDLVSFVNQVDGFDISVGQLSFLSMAQDSGSDFTEKKHVGTTHARHPENI
jgi:hypothetical protein